MTAMTPTLTPRPELNREIATTADGIDITRGYTGPLLQPYDSVLRSRGGGDLRIYEEVFSDAEVKSTFAQRQLAVTQCEWQVDAGGYRPIDIEAADYLRAQLHGIGWDNVTTKMLTGVFYGYACAEVIYKVDAGRIGIAAIKVRNRRRFRFGKEGELRLLTQHEMTEGIPALAPYFWSFNAGADHDDEPYGLGLAHWLYWPVLFKRNGIKFWLIFLEKFGMPTAVGKYDTDASEADRARLLQATRVIQTDSGMIMPKGMELELLEAARSGTADYKTLQDVMDAAIQKVVLGQTASTQGTAGKLGNDDLQAEVRADIIKADADLVCESFNTGPARWLTEWNFPGAAIPRVYRITAEPEDLNALAERDAKVSMLGYKRTLASVQDLYGEGWEEKQGPVVVPESAPGQLPAMAPGGTAGVAFAEGAGSDAADTSPAVPLGEQLDRKLRPVGSRWIEQIRALVMKAETFEQLQEELLALSADMDLDEYAQVLAEASTAAALAGRADVLQRRA